MERTFWVKQEAGKPIFPDLVWSRPENKTQAGKLLIIGGNLHGFSAPASAYNHAAKADIGTARVLLPDALKRTVGPILENGEYSSTTPSGSFSQKALGDWLELAMWSDAVLLAGDLGRNSETAIVIEKFVQKFQGLLAITKDAVDYFKDLPELAIDRPNTTLVMSFAQLQKLAMNSGSSLAFTFEMGLLQLVDVLHEFSQSHIANIIVKHREDVLVASEGQVSSTKLNEDQEIWRVPTAASATVWWLQNPDKPFEALTTSLASS